MRRSISPKREAALRKESVVHPTSGVTQSEMEAPKSEHMGAPVEPQVAPPPQAQLIQIPIPPEAGPSAPMHPLPPNGVMMPNPGEMMGHMPPGMMPPGMMPPGMMPGAHMMGEQMMGGDDDDDDDDDEGVPAKRKRGGHGRRKIEIEYIDDKIRRHITFSKRKAGISKKAYELSRLTGAQVRVWGMRTTDSAPPRARAHRPRAWHALAPACPSRDTRALAVLPPPPLRAPACGRCSS